MSGEEEIVEIAHHREAEIPQRVQEWIIGERYSCFPYLVSPVDVYYAESKENYEHIPIRAYIKKN